MVIKAQAPPADKNSRNDKITADPHPYLGAMGTTKGHHIHLSHPQLGSIKGLVPIEGVHQFRSLPYATIPYRLHDPILVNSLGIERTFDATEFGSIAPQSDDAEYQEFVTPKEHIPHKPLVQDEFKCCNLNVSVPIGVREDGGKRLPVMVWFHGGSFMLGSASWPQYGMYIDTVFDIVRCCKIRKIIGGEGTARYWSWCQVFPSWISVDLVIVLEL